MRLDELFAGRNIGAHEHIEGAIGHGCIFDGHLQERHISLLEASFLPEIMGDELCITRAFRNLLDNALKYGGERLGEIRIGYEQNRSHHIFSVTDNGGGFDQEEAKKLFQLFQRLETSSQIAGSGMGLAIVKEIAKKHLGDVWVESVPGWGATFYLSVSRNLESMDPTSFQKKTNRAE